MNEYFVVYAFEHNNTVAISNMTLKYDKPVSEYTDIENLEKSIEIIKKVANVKLINWKKLEKNTID
jgi:hypothetical protein